MHEGSTGREVTQPVQHGGGIEESARHLACGRALPRVVARHPREPFGRTLWIHERNYAGWSVKPT